MTRYKRPSSHEKSYRNIRARFDKTVSLIKTIMMRLQAVLLKNVHYGFLKIKIFCEKVNNAGKEIQTRELVDTSNKDICITEFYLLNNSSVTVDDLAVYSCVNDVLDDLPL